MYNIFDLASLWFVFSNRIQMYKFVGKLGRKYGGVSGPACTSVLVYMYVLLGRSRLEFSISVKVSRVENFSDSGFGDSGWLLKLSLLNFDVFSKLLTFIDFYNFNWNFQPSVCMIPQGSIRILRKVSMHRQ